MLDTDDWSIDNSTFLKVCREFGHPTVDRFADNLNAKVRCFNSKFHCPGSQAVNAFTQDWAATSLNWICPPVKFIIPAINHLRLCRAKGIIIIPQWPSSHFWPIIHNGLSFQDYIKKVLILRPYYISSSNSVFNGLVKFNTLALLIDFS